MPACCRAVGEEFGPIGRAVVGHDSLDPHPQPTEPVERPHEEGSRILSAQAGQHLGVGQPAGVIDGDVQMIPADPPAFAKANTLDAPRIPGATPPSWRCSRRGKAGPASLRAPGAPDPPSHDWRSASKIRLRRPPEAASGPPSRFRGCLPALLARRGLKRTASQANRSGWTIGSSRITPSSVHMLGRLNRVPWTNAMPSLGYSSLNLPDIIFNTSSAPLPRDQLANIA